MDTFMQFFTTFAADGKVTPELTMAFIAASVFCLTIGIMFFLSGYFDPVRSRFLKDSVGSTTAVIDDDKNHHAFAKYQELLLPSDKALIGRTTQRLHHAGFHYRRNLYQYFALKLVLMITLPIAALVVTTMIFGPSFESYLQATLIAVAVGFTGPSFVLDYLIKQRQKNIQRAFPDALDLLVVCSEAGMGLDGALQKVAIEIAFSQPILAKELSLVIAEIRAGVDRKKAFNGLVERTGVEDVRGLMSAINQSIRFGSSIAETLRVYSEDFRDKRMQAAEEKAAKIGAKLIFPLALCLLPCFLVIVLVPFALNLAKFFNGM